MRRPSGRASMLKVGETLAYEEVGALEHDCPVDLGDVRVLLGQLQLTDQPIADRMCPVQLPDGTAQVWVLPEYAYDDQARALVLALAQLGMTVAKPSRQVVSAARLGELNRGLRVGMSNRQMLGTVASTPKHVLLSLLDDLIAWALKSDASDIHLTIRHEHEFADIAFTVNGSCVRPEAFARLSTQMVLELLAVSWMTVQGGNGAVFDQTCEQQGRFDRVISGESIGLRWASLVVQGGVSVCWRLLNRACWHEPASLAALGYDASQRARLLRATEGCGGLVVFAGLVGSGKSTSLAALMRSIPQTRKIITLEDPVEYVIANALQCPVSGFELKAAGSQLASKLKTIKRSAAHDVLIGELRDTLGGQAVVDLVLAGTNVYTTVHASSALQILTRLSSELIGVPQSLLTMPGFVKLLIYQVLLKQLCPQCSIRAADWHQGEHAAPDMLAMNTTEKRCWLDRLAHAVGGDWGNWRFRDPAGCHQCRRSEHLQGSGYQSRLLVTEMIEPAISPTFYSSLANRPLWDQVAQWQWSANRASTDLVGYRPVAQEAAMHLDAGRIDPRDYVLRFAPVLQEKT